MNQNQQQLTLVRKPRCTERRCCQRRLLAIVAAACVASTAAVCASAEDPAAADVRFEQREASAQAARVMKRIECKHPGENEEPFHCDEQSLLKWSNPDVGRVYGDVYLWTQAGRPAAIASIYRWFSPYESLNFEFCSLSETAVGAEYNDEQVWNTAAGGIEWRELSGRRPVASRTARLTQMRQLAARFSAELTDERTDGQSVGRVLRRLTTPLYRYADHADADGALFAFVVGTDPELILLIETAADGWRYATARMNRDALQVFLDEELISTYAHVDEPDLFDSSLPYFVHLLRIDATDSGASGSPEEARP